MRVSVKKNYKIQGSKGSHLIFIFFFSFGKSDIFTQPPPLFCLAFAYMSTTPRPDLIARPSSSDSDQIF